jgi:ATP-dependent helicase STH1/SNF2
MARLPLAERLAHGTMLTIRDARMTEQLERKQGLERERRAKHKHVEQLTVICNHGKELLAVNRVAQERVMRLG